MVNLISLPKLMSILVSESFVNDHTPLWATIESALDKLKVDVQAEGTGGNIEMYPGSSFAIYTADASSYAVAGGSYIAYVTLLLTDISGGSGQVPVGFTMVASNSIGNWNSGATIYSNVNLSGTGGDVSFCMPFVSDGSDAGLKIYAYNISNDDIQFGIEIVTQSFMYLGQAIQTGNIFQPV